MRRFHAVWLAGVPGNLARHGCCFSSGPVSPNETVDTMNKLLTLWKNESGQDLAEYAMMIGLVALAVVTAVAVLGANIAVTFDGIGTNLDAAT